MEGEGQGLIGGNVHATAAFPREGREKIDGADLIADMVWIGEVAKTAGEAGQGGRIVEAACREEMPFPEIRLLVSLTLEHYGMPLRIYSSESLFINGNRCRPTSKPKGKTM